MIFIFIWSRKFELNWYCDVDSALDVTSVKFESEVFSDGCGVGLPSRLSSIKLPLPSENLLCHLNTNERLTLECVTDRLMNVSRQFLRKFGQSGIGFLDRIITTDETWFHYYDPEKKQQSSQWKNVDIAHKCDSCVVLELKFHVPLSLV
jgi:hypothetical protein